MTDISTPYPGVKATWYAFKCGAIFPLFSLKKSHQYTLTTPTRKGTTKHLCPCCGAGLAYRICACEDCGRSFNISALGTPSKRCPACQKEYRKKRKRVWELRDREAKIDDGPMVPPKSDCLFYLQKCLPEAAFANKACVDCRGCSRYTPIFAHATMSVGCSFVETGRPRM